MSKASSARHLLVRLLYERMVSPAWLTLGDVHEHAVSPAGVKRAQMCRFLISTTVKLRFPEKRYRERIWPDSSSEDFYIFTTRWISGSSRVVCQEEGTMLIPRERCASNGELVIFLAAVLKTCRA